MKIKSAILVLLSGWSLVSGASDTPFIMRLKCLLQHRQAKSEFFVDFHNDDSNETQYWSNATKRTQVKFEKQDSHTLLLTISNGLPLVGVAAPTEYAFTAPLDNERFTFALTPQGPVRGHKQSLLSLSCERAHD